MKVKSRQFFFIFFIGLVLVFSLGFKLPKKPSLVQPVGAAEGRLQEEVKTILKRNCSVSGCHRGTYHLSQDEFEFGRR
jgi:hypothetical protein